MTDQTNLLDLRKDFGTKYGFRDEVNVIMRTSPGLSKEVVETISRTKGEPQWLLDFRLRALEIFMKKPMPTWGADLSVIDFDKIVYYVKPTEKQENSWDDVPEGIRNTFERLGIPEAERKFLAGVGAQYECLDGDSVVFTNPKGPVKIKNVGVGDKVFSFDEKSNKLIMSKVTGVSFKGDRKTYEVTVGIKKIKATENHPFLALIYKKKDGKRRGRYIREWRYLKDLKQGDLVAVVKKLPIVGTSYILPSIDMNERDKNIHVPEKTSEDLMWFLGLYLGDGFIHHEKNKRKARIEIAIPEQDEQLQKELISTIEELFGYKAKIPDKWRISINSTTLSQWIEKLEFDGKALTKTIPSWVFSLPKNEILAFLGGYIDADGYVRDSKKNHDISITSANKKILEKTRDLCTYCGISSSNVNSFFSKHPIDKNKQIQGFRLQLSGAFDEIKCRSEKRLSRMRKRKHFHNQSAVDGSTIRKHVTDEIGFSKIKEIKPANIRPVYDIEVEGPHNFISEGIIVHNSESVYHKIREDLAKQGVMFISPDQALIPEKKQELVDLGYDEKHVERVQGIFKKHFSTIIPPEDNKFAALNSAVFSGGSFIYIPPGVEVNMPLQAYFRINSESFGQFERTLIIADEDSKVSYLEGCTAPVYSKDSLHSAVVELIAMPRAKLRYTTLQNWSNNVYNLVTKRAFAYEDAYVDWLDANIGSKITMKYPSVYMVGPRAKANILSVAYAGKDQHQDAGGKVVHLAPNTTSTILSKSVSKDNGRTSYRGLVKVAKDATGVKSNVRCDALLLDEASRSDTYPYMQIEEEDTTISHEASVGKIGEDQIFYLMARGMSESEALAMIILGFVQPFTKELPMEYAIEFNRLIQLEMAGAVG